MQHVNEDCLLLDSNRLAQMGIFKARHIRAEAQWEGGSNILLVYMGEHMNLKYSVNGRPYTQEITISTMPCHFGGFRYYFYCPACSTRRVNLLLGMTGFYCRECYDLPYCSQVCRYLDRLITKNHALQNRLWGENRRPMRKSTRRCLIARLNSIQDEINKESMRRFGVLIC